MSNAKTKSIKKTSPVGQAQWFKLVTPDQKYNKYSVDLVVEDSPEIRAIIDMMEEMKESKLAEQKEADPKKAKKVVMSINTPIEPQVNDNGEETGKFIMKFRDGSEGKKKDGTIYKKAAPTIFDKSAKPISKSELETMRVPNGSSMKVAFDMVPYYVPSIGVGVTLKPKAAMILKLEQVAQAADFGFSPSEFAEQDDSDHEEFSSEEESDADSDF